MLFTNKYNIGLVILKSKIWIKVARCSFDEKKKLKKLCKRVRFLRTNRFCMSRSSVLYRMSSFFYQALVTRNIITNSLNTH